MYTKPARQPAKRAAGTNEPAGGAGGRRGRGLLAPWWVVAVEVMELEEEEEEEEGV